MHIYFHQEYKYAPEDSTLCDTLGFQFKPCKRSLNRSVQVRLFLQLLRNGSCQQMNKEHCQTRQLTVGTTVTKNCEPLVPGPAFAILSVYGRSCLSVAWNSSSNSPPQILSPPMPVPVGSPVWIIKPCTQDKDLDTVYNPQSDI